jgi:hypothetical protein
MNQFFYFLFIMKNFFVSKTINPRIHSYSEKYSYYLSRLAAYLWEKHNRLYLTGIF